MGSLERSDKRRQRRDLLQKIRDFSGGYVRCNDARSVDLAVELAGGDASPARYNPCRVNDGALLDLKTRNDGTTHARRCIQCSYPLYRDELCCPLCGRRCVFFGLRHQLDV